MSAIPPAKEPVIILVQGPGLFRRLFESGLLFFCSILFLRAFAVEPFGVPTGSMAATLNGNHRIAECPRCKYRFAIGEPSANTDPEVYSQACKNLRCPNCGANEMHIEEPLVHGDRLLVDKNIYHLRSPHRWEVAVFRCPVDPSKPYVKRIVGLPGESIQLLQGDVWVNRDLSRKTLDQCLETALPVFDAEFAPEERGWRKRWVVERSYAPDTPGSPFDGTEPTADSIFQGNELHLDATLASNFRQTLTYRNWNLDRDREEVLYEQFPYNVTQRNGSIKYALTDFIVEFELECLRGTGPFWCQLTDGSDLIRWEWGSSCTLIHDQQTIVRSRSQLPLQPGERYRIMMAFADRRISVSINGRQPFPSFDLPAIPARVEVTRPFRLGTQGTSVVIRNLKLYRDIYYMPKGTHANQTPYPLGDTEYFVLGDNSANSDDSRFWKTPGVPESHFLGKPFLLHQPSRLVRWNLFGLTRESQAIDWSRIRWIR